MEALVTTLLQSKELVSSLEALASAKQVNFEDLKTALSSVAPKLSEMVKTGQADVASLALVLMGGAFNQVSDEELDTKGTDLLAILFRDNSVLEALKNDASGSSNLSVEQIESVLPGIASLVAQEVSKAMTGQGQVELASLFMPS